VTTSTLDSYTGEAMSIGERTPAALLSYGASARMAVAESITNIASARIEKISDLKLSANWMSSAGHPGEDAGLYEAVEAIGMELCPELGITIPVGKDSMSMKTKWKDGTEDKSVVSPLSLIITAFAPVQDVRKSLTPQLRNDLGDTGLVFIDLAGGKARMGASILAECFQQLGSECPDLDSPKLLKNFFGAVQVLNSKIIAYHDRSDGGLFTTLVEMAFAGKVGLEINIDGFVTDALTTLFNEELGAVIQVKSDDLQDTLATLTEFSLGEVTHVIGKVREDNEIKFLQAGQEVLSDTRENYRAIWSKVTLEMQSLRDNRECALEDYEIKLDETDPGLNIKLSFDINEDITKGIIGNAKIAILREQGVNGQVEMAAAFTKAGFESHDVHMSDILSGEVSLQAFDGLVACGGFSYGDVLGAGEGWAKSILFNPLARKEFQDFFERPNTFSLGVCNGCQMLSNLKELIPGAAKWPHFVQNKSDRFEARFSLVKIEPSKSIFFTGMVGSQMPIAVAHGEGRAEFSNDIPADQVAARFVDHFGEVAEEYPLNPNGSPEGITSLCSEDGRVTIMMPHPERVFRAVQHSWAPDSWQENGPWLKMFKNAHKWVVENK
jgi:phosphoribosylformylglycinamidine synthase